MEAIIMKVKLIAYTPDPLKTLATATLTSYWDEWNIDNIANITDTDAELHIPRVLSYGHESILEHITLTFAVEGVSIVTLKQITRHRLASFTVRSQRYIAENKEARYIIPPSIKDKGWDNLVESKILELFSIYDDLINAGVPPEDARYILPQATETKFVVTMNMREFKHFLGLRMCARAQWEIRELAYGMFAEVMKVPELRKIVIWSKAAPRCIQLGYCPEGTLMPEGCVLKQKKWWKNIVNGGGNIE